jgi:hypothetical protein
MFKNFPQFGYALDSRLIVATDIFRRVALSDIAINELLLTKYTIEAGQKPEDVADILYDDPKLYWVVLLVNNIIDPYNEWYFTPEQIRSLVEDKYGVGNSGNTHHYIVADNPLVCVQYDAQKLASGEIKEISHLEHEQLENDARQNISVINPRYIQDFLTEFNRLANE